MFTYKNIIAYITFAEPKYIDFVNYLVGHIAFINALVFTNDGYLFIPKRSGKSTVSKHKITSSIAAGFKLANDEDKVLDFVNKDKKYIKIGKDISIYDIFKEVESANVNGGDIDLSRIFHLFSTEDVIDIYKYLFVDIISCQNNYNNISKINL